MVGIAPETPLGGTGYANTPSGALVILHQIGFENRFLKKRFEEQLFFENVYVKKKRFIEQTMLLKTRLFETVF